ncbi:hypothetical protein [Aliikangiella coralliicola]|uniref:Outer membrane protein beta-barrel domain-containing protein n=1 Tax=Aliikangiella coralliicola TaxID=2592383 RepID=A0A545UDQ2_9GAMM|nr:hypothetical protein [Aliikangiella coralliicola]TQV87579.1 hypothetical protein FLL46_11955 [Aliikangiella coralliicola]
MKSILIPLVFFACCVFTLDCPARLLAENKVTKNSLNFTYSAKDSLTKDDSSYGMVWSMEIEHTPFKIFEEKYQFSFDVSAERSDSKSSTEKTETKKYGLGLRFSSIESYRKFKPFISLGIENISESKVTETESVFEDYDASFKWGVGFTFPIVENGSSDSKYEPILGLEVGKYINYDKFLFEEKIFDELKISIVFDISAFMSK